MSAGELGLRPWPDALGQALVATLFTTAALALVVRGLLHRAGRPAPLLRYRLAWGGLWVAAGLGVLSLAVARHPGPPEIAHSGPTAPVVSTVAPPTGRAEPWKRLPSLRPEVPPVPAGLASVLGWAWVAGATLLLARVAGGWLLSRGIRRRSVPVTEPRIVAAVQALARRLGADEVDLRESTEIDAPATVGVLRSTVVLPAGIDHAMSPGVLEALLAHEVGHVAAGDGAAALAQALLDSLLFPCPGAMYLSARAREAREHRSDDFAAEVSGLGIYARALATLVDRRAWGAVGALGASSPRLSDRLRRLVDGEPTMKLTRAGSIALSVATAALTLLSFGAVAATARPSDGAKRSLPRVPYAYSPQQPGAPARLSNVKISRSASPFLFTAVRVRNATEATLRSVTLVAVLEGRGRPAAPAKLIPSEPIAISLAPGQAADLSLNLVTPIQVAEAEKHFGTPAQSWLAVLRVGFDGGNAWRVVPQDGATRAIDALYLRQTPEVSRRLVSAPKPPVPSDAWRLCLDDAGFEFSPGASVAIRDEPGHFAVCHQSGVFVESPIGEDGSSN